MIRKRKVYFGFTHNDIFRLTHASFEGQEDKEKLVKASFTRGTLIISIFLIYFLYKCTYIDYVSSIKIEEKC